MNTGVILKASAGSGEPAGAARADGWRRPYSASAASIALWIFMGVATSLFSLFIMAYALRMDGSDWSPIAMPWQLWLSTALLAAGSVALQAAYGEARHERSHRLLLAGGLCALAFLCVQLWAWRVLLAKLVMPVGNPAGSFFYLLTAMHGLHVAGGLAGWGLTMRRAATAGRSRAAQAIGLCARYWHFLLAVWVLLFAALGWLTPAVVRFICGTP